MQQRFLSIWFKYLLTDWQVLRRPSLAGKPFAFARSERGRKIISGVNSEAEEAGVIKGMNVADANAIFPGLEIIDAKPEREEKLLRAIGEWAIRYAPIVAIDMPDGLMLDISGCTHLWGGEPAYLDEIEHRLSTKGYQVLLATASTIGAAWAAARYLSNKVIIPASAEAESLLELPPAALRLERMTIEKLHKLGLLRIKDFIYMPKSALRRRFGDTLPEMLSKAVGNEQEYLQPLITPEPYHERLPCLDPIRNAAGIEVAIKKLLQLVCKRLHKETKGLRKAQLRCYRIDGEIEQVIIGTSKATNHIEHLFKLFQLHISTIKAGFGIELFTIDAIQIEAMQISQEVLWSGHNAQVDEELAELLDRIAGKLGANNIHRYLPDEHYWPERSLKLATTLDEKPTSSWAKDRPRPTLLLNIPVSIDVTAPVPDYPPMSFRYKDNVHYIDKADGPERIEREWWNDAGEHRDYYQVEDKSGQRYWIFRLGHYGSDAPSQWFLHGFFA